MAKCAASRKLLHIWKKKGHATTRNSTQEHLENTEQVPSGELPVYESRLIFIKDLLVFSSVPKESSAQLHSLVAYEKELRPAAVPLNALQIKMKYITLMAL